MRLSDDNHDTVRLQKEGELSPGVILITGRVSFAPESLQLCGDLKILGSLLISTD